MLKRAEFSKYRGFERMEIGLAPNAYIVGPNSAGKSTVVETVALAEKCLQKARRQGPTQHREHRGETRHAYPLPIPVLEEGEDPVHFDFGTDEARATLEWENGASLHLVWPEADDESVAGFFYLEGPDGRFLHSTAAVRAAFEPITIVPIVAPLDRVEELKDQKYTRKLAGSRLASRHFRNHALQMKKDGVWDSFRGFAAQWIPEIELLDVEFYALQNRLAMYYLEQGSRVPKEIAWAGDGIQIWLQLLWHIHRSGEAKIILLDEPEVYLHPDLQRRLVRLLDGLSAQVILATHSADVVAEASPRSVVWIDRRTNEARRVVSENSLAALSSSLGTSFNLALARSARAKVIVATDCADLRVFRSLGREVGAHRLAGDQAATVVQLREASAWSAAGHLGAALRGLLPSTLPAVVLLQRGYLSNAEMERVAFDLRAPGNRVIWWGRPELTNSLLHPAAVARVSGAAPEAVEDRIDDVVAGLRESARAEFCSTAMRSAAGSAADSLVLAEQEFDRLWSDRSRRLGLVRGSEVVAGLNDWLEGEGYRGVSDVSLAKTIRLQELPAEVLSVLLEIEELAS